MDVVKHNRNAWDRYVKTGNPWTVPVSPERIAAARRGDWSVILTPTKPVPREWFGPVDGARILCLASGGGQQASVLAAAGGRVTLLDNSPRQLDQDRNVAARDSLDLRLELGTMTDLSRFDDKSFDLVFHPVSNVFVPDVRPVWREAFRVLRPGGRMLAGIVNPLVYLFDDEEIERSDPVVRYPIPYSDLECRSPERLRDQIESGEALEFGHSLEDQIGGQIDAGFVLTGLFEDRDPESPLARFAPTFLATRATKPPLEVASSPERGPRDDSRP